ncbi:MAG TPA: monofunctional biosynthetic peptidoglycan transglycosylase, partial [Dongiaceae bacterium]|nr:monofunctional biosynthetic peptidoglycan transglycosylase [Dongiaceae bacterium]
MAATSRRWPRRLLRFLFRFTLVFMLVSALLVLTLRWVDPPYWAWRVNRALFPPPGYPAEPRHAWVDLANIAKGMQLAVIAAEDQHFPEHHGFDFNAIARALDHNEHGRSVRGASTLTQQTAKNLFLWPSRSFVRKGIEAWFTLLIELMWTKQRTLEIYLNVVEFGPGIYGVESAAR